VCHGLLRTRDFFSINIEMHLLVFQYILDMINAPKMEHIKTFRVC